MLHVVNGKNKGICCDLCGVAYDDKFTYYSAKFDLVEVDISLGKTGIKQIDRRFMDLDLCTNCMNQLMERVKNKIQERDAKGTWNTKVDKKLGG